MAEALIGFEVLRLDEYDERAPWQMTVDAWVDGKIVRYQLTGPSYERRNRTLEEVARVQGQWKRRDEIASQFDALDREYGEKIAALIRELQREQARVLYGQQGVDLIDREDAERASTETHEERR
jgi:hypothetical protein